MKERRFVFKDVTNCFISYEDSLQQITESELDSRLIAIYALDGDGMYLSRAKQTLLHGAGGQCMPIDKPHGEKGVHPTKCTCELCKRFPIAGDSITDDTEAIQIRYDNKPKPTRREGKSRLVYNKETRTIDSVAPDGSKIATPTRKDWEEWADRMETHIIMRDDIKNAFLTMPGVPK